MNTPKKTKSQMEKTAQDEMDSGMMYLKGWLAKECLNGSL